MLCVLLPSLGNDCWVINRIWHFTMSLKLLPFVSTNLIYQMLLGKGEGDQDADSTIPGKKKSTFSFLSGSLRNYTQLVSIVSLQTLPLSKSCPGRCEREQMQNLSGYPHLCFVFFFLKKRTEAAQKEVKDIIAGLNYDTFHLWAEGQLPAGGAHRPILLGFKGGPPFLSRDSCKPAAHSITIRHRVASRNADMDRSGPVCFGCTPAW